jgi:hypothetical protein
VGEELLLAFMLFVAPVGDEDHSARVGALVGDLLLAIPALEVQSPFIVDSAVSNVGLVGHAAMLSTRRLGQCSGMSPERRQPANVRPNARRFCWAASR